MLFSLSPNTYKGLIIKRTLTVHKVFPRTAQWYCYVEDIGYKNYVSTFEEGGYQKDKQFSLLIKLLLKWLDMTLK